MVNPQLRADNPQLAEVLDQLLERYERSYDLSNRSDAADFYEGIREFAKIVAHGQSASIQVSVGDEGVTRINVSAMPRPRR